jgi:excisionase family DNA binding protein
MEQSGRPDRADGADSLVSVKHAAARLSCSEAAIRKWLTQGKLQRVKVGKLTRIRTQDLDACVRLGLHPQETH